MNIESLRAAISSMSDEELYATLKDIRANRRVSKKQEKEKKVKIEKASLDLSKIINNMSEEDKAGILSLLEGI